MSTTKPSTASPATAPSTKATSSNSTSPPRRTVSWPIPRSPSKSAKSPPPPKPLVRCAESAFHQALKVATAGARIYEIGRAVEHEVRRCNFSVVREFCGHGVGRAIHESPSIPNHFDPRYRSKLTEGLVITIEPIISAGNGKTQVQPDHWTQRTTDRTLAAHYEHTLVITRAAPILLTA